MQKIRFVYFDPVEQVSVEKLRSTMGDYLDRVNFRNESFLITRHGSPFALLAPTSNQIVPTQCVNARDLRTGISGLLGQVYYQGAILNVLRRGKPVATIVNFQAHRPGED